LKGSCQFLRRDVLEKLSGFDEKALSEDMEISARLTENGYRVKYAPDVCARQESPASLRQLFRQRIRWYRGTMEVAFKYGRLMAKPSRRSVDAETTLFGPFVLIASLAVYLGGFGAFSSVFQLDALWRLLMQSMAVIATFTIVLCGVFLAYVSKPRRAANLLWLPFVYFYWSLQAFIALFSALCVVFRRKRLWVKTEKTGRIATGSLEFQKTLN
jgi:cellulose synthase/poly-beta-1,6-N-acetylglucosamine synthase-like glycosyltransferase